MSPIPDQEKLKTLKIPEGLSQLSANRDKIEKITQPIIVSAHSLLQPQYGYRVPLKYLWDATPSTNDALQRLIEQEIFQKLEMNVEYDHRAKIMKVTSARNGQTLTVSGAPRVNHFKGTARAFERDLTTGMREVLTALMVAEPEDFTQIARDGLLTGIWQDPNKVKFPPGHSSSHIALPGSVFRKSGIAAPDEVFEDNTLYLHDTDRYPLSNSGLNQTISPVAFLGYDLQVTG